MTDYLAIAALTSRIHQFLFDSLSSEFSNIDVTTRPPDKARASDAMGPQVNLFLYHIVPDAAWRNMDLPNKVRPGERSYPLLPLKLYYLLTAYYGDVEEGISIEGDDENKHITGSLKLLGKAMSLLHDHPSFNADFISEILPAKDKVGHPFYQVENVRITLQPLSLEEMSKLWNTFQTNYRTSVAYEVSAVLIESSNVTIAPLPVLKRGEGDRGVISTASLPPVLYNVKPPEPQPSARLGEMLVIEGDLLDIGDITLLFSAPHLSKPIERFPLSVNGSKKIRLMLPDNPEFEVLQPDGSIVLDSWPIGFYRVSAAVNRPGMSPWTTNEVPFILAPSIKVDTFPPRNPPRSTDSLIINPSDINPGTGNIDLEISCLPRLKDGQKAHLLFGDRQVQVNPDIPIPDTADARSPTKLRFSIPGVKKGEYVIRLRVDGVDSLPIPINGSPERMAFDPKQKVIVMEST